MTNKYLFVITLILLKTSFENEAINEILKTPEVSGQDDFYFAASKRLSTSFQLMTLKNALI